MSDQERLEKLIGGDTPCVSISTFEEDYALELVREAAMSLGRPMLVWSVSGGVQDGLHWPRRR